METSTIVAVMLVLLFLVASLFYPAIMVAALWAAPVFKLGLTYYIPFFQTVDVTALVCGAALVVGVWHYLRRGRMGRPLMLPWGMLGCLGGLALMLFVGLGHTTAPNYGLTKAVRFAGMGIPFLLLPSFYVRGKPDGHAMIRVLILVGAVTAGFLMCMQESRVAEHVEGAYGRAKVLGGASGIAAQVVGLGVLTISAFLVLKGSASKVLRFAALVGLPLGVTAILLSGSRSSLLYLFLAAMVLPFLVGRGQRTKAAGLLGVLLPLALVIVFTQLAAGGWELGSRWTRFMERSGHAVESRTRLFAFVAANWSSSPIVGHGSGSFAMDYMGVDDKEAPHNIVLEALYEAGLLGAALVLLFFFFAARTAARGLREIPDGSAQDRLLVIAPILMTLFLGLRSMSSVDMAEIRYLYLACGLLHANVSHLVYSNRNAAPAPRLSLTRAGLTGMR